VPECSGKVLRVFLFVIHSHFALRFICLQTHATSYMQFLQFSFCTLYIKEDNLIENHTPLPCCLRSPYRNLNPENCQDYAQKPQRNCTFMNSVHVPFRLSLSPLSLNQRGLHPLCLRHLAFNRSPSTTLPSYIL
jgi:hypothetical protein